MEELDLIGIALFAAFLLSLMLFLMNLISMAKDTPLKDQFFEFVKRYQTMAYKDLREFLSVLEKNGQLLRITEPILPEPDIASAACAGTKLGDQSPALLFENIRGYKTARSLFHDNFLPGCIRASLNLSRISRHHLD